MRASFFISSNTKYQIDNKQGWVKPPVVAKWYNSPCFKFKLRQTVRSQVRIPARDYNTDGLKLKNIGIMRIHWSLLLHYLIWCHDWVLSLLSQSILIRALFLLCIWRHNSKDTFTIEPCPYFLFSTIIVKTHLHQSTFLIVCLGP